MITYFFEIFIFSGVGVGSFGSSNSSDITEPCSPALSCGSLEEMPPTQNHPTWIWDKEKVSFHHTKPGLETPSSDDSLLEPSEPSEPSPPPPTIRFPPPPTVALSHPHIARLPTLLSHYLCRWTDCPAQLTSSSALIEHLQVIFALISIMLLLIHTFICLKKYIFA